MRGRFISLEGGEGAGKSTQVRLLAEVKRLAGAGYGVVLATHDPDHAFAVGTRVALLNGGRLIADGTPEAVLTPARLAEVYGVKVEIARTPAGAVLCAPDYAAVRG